MKRLLLVPLAVGLAALVLGLSAHPVGEVNGGQEKTAKTEGNKEGGDKVAKAICVLVPMSKSKVQGVIHFTQKGKTVTIKGEVTGLTPGKHAFHVHEFGDLTDSKGMSTGGHFDPEHMKHGAPEAEMRHVGDLGNITANDDGNAKIQITDTVVQLHGPHSIIGRAIIIHEKADDFGQPVGNAGGRIAAGVIGVAKVAAPK
jgi:Cu-Zn family superoxide dismutase